MSLIRIVLILTLWILSSSPVRADCTQYDDYLKWVAGADTPGDGLAVAAHEDLVLVADGEFGVHVFRQTGDKIVLLSTVDTDFARHVVMDSLYAYVADDAGMLVIDLSAPEEARVIGSATGSFNRVRVLGDYVFACSNSRLRSIDVSDPTDPHIVGSVFRLPISDIFLQDHHLYVITYWEPDPPDQSTATLAVYDVSDPTNFSVLVGELVIPEYAKGLCVLNDHAYVAHEEFGIRVYDVSNPAAPIFVSDARVGGYSYGVAANGDHVYLANSHYGLFEFDVSDPSAPRNLGRVGLPGQGLDVVVLDERAIVANADHGFQVIDVTNQGSPPLVGFKEIDNQSYGIALHGGFAYIANKDFGLTVVDVDPPSDPLIRANLRDDGQAYSVAIGGEFAYVANGVAGIRVVDISDPANPFHRGKADTPGFAYQLTLDSSILYVADYESGIQVVDVTDPGLPILVGGLTLSDYALGTALSGSHMYVAIATPYSSASGGLAVLDTSDPTDPILVRELAFPDDSWSIAVEGQYAFVGTGRSEDNSGTLRVIDISDPETAHEVAALPVPTRIRTIEVQDGVAYCAARQSGLLVIDVADPLAPNLIGSVATPDIAAGVAVSASFIGIADNWSGIVNLWRQCSGPSSVLHEPLRRIVGLPRPNPTSSGTHLELLFHPGEPVTMTIFDSGGRQVRDLSTRANQHGVAAFDWDTKDQRGADVASGIFLARIHSGNQARTTRITVVR